MPYPRALILGCIAMVAAALSSGSLPRNHGQFAYTLDARYTHLALAEPILQGTYGLNEGEPASPSSSILYPFLPALLSWMKAGAIGILAVIAPAQLMGGSLGSFSRDEVYVLALGTCALMVACQPEVNAWLERPGRLLCLGPCFAMLVLTGGYVFHTADAVSASGNVHDQQQQMHRFVTEYWQQPYATNQPSGLGELAQPALQARHFGPGLGRDPAQPGQGRCGAAARMARSVGGAAWDRPRHGV
ncbi:hypothetical protein JMJ55_06720 [Belnapia sp. T6]|uniref:Glycosyltransferase RgtA/B/C/D-like domain-containing protein n=1 Tax=Belnapia mucosa TaxID=2804532 RepID=A0ABS1UZX0_9PROT|nr:hypothetical protein [Belnapia mucosa]MBL6455010.1 hypothetical protein [Belnapia mucosa]